jgi:small subunit ribosomal protein S1
MDDQETMLSALGIAAANPMDALPMDAFNVPSLRVGDTRDGTIASISPAEILVNIGYKSDAIVDPRELERLDRSFIADLRVGDPVTVCVTHTEDRDGYVVVSLSRARQEQDWREAEDLLQSQDVFEGVVTGYNRGGVIVRVGRVRGFVPASQLSPHWQVQQDAEGNPDERRARLVGQKMQLKGLELDRQRNRLILSERLAMRDWRKGQKDRLLSQ